MKRPIIGSPAIVSRSPSTEESAARATTAALVSCLRLQRDRQIAAISTATPEGLHLRPAGNLCKEAMKYKSKITFEYSGNTANAKSVLSVLGACIKSGDEITLVCDGEDEHEALRELVAYVESGLGE